jgi:hypothetical protein
MHLGYFPWVSSLAWLSLLPAGAWELIRVPTRGGVDVDRNAPRAGLAAIIAMLIFASNITSAFPKIHLPLLAQRAMRGLYMEQRWIMFIRPIHAGWYVAPATLADGRVIDLLAGGRPVSWEKPESVSGTFPNMRWRKYITDLSWERQASVRDRELFARFLCRQWNGPLTDSDQRMLSVDIVFMQQDRRTDGTWTPVLKRTLAHRECFPGSAEAPDDSAPFFDIKPPPAAAPPETPDEEHP